MWPTLSQLAPVVDRAPHCFALVTADIHQAINLASFTHLVCMQANGVKFAHQSLCNPRISMLLKAVHKGFLKGCPNLSKKLILKYLNLSPATAKGHMKRPQHSIHSTFPKPIAQQLPVPSTVNVQLMQDIVGPGPHIVGTQPVHHIIDDNIDKLIASVF